MHPRVLYELNIQYFDMFYIRYTIPSQYTVYTTYYATGSSVTRVWQTRREVGAIVTDIHRRTLSYSPITVGRRLRPGERHSRGVRDVREIGREFTRLFSKTTGRCGFPEYARIISVGYAVKATMRSDDISPFAERGRVIRHRCAGAV